MTETKSLVQIRALATPQGAELYLAAFFFIMQEEL
jgi:hypothetical protein